MNTHDILLTLWRRARRTAQPCVRVATARQLRNALDTYHAQAHCPDGIVTTTDLAHYRGLVTLERRSDGGCLLFNRRAAAGDTDSEAAEWLGGL